MGKTASTKRARFLVVVFLRLIVVSNGYTLWTRTNPRRRIISTSSAIGRKSGNSQLLFNTKRYLAQEKALPFNQKHDVKIKTCLFGDLGACADLLVWSFYSGNSTKPPWLQLTRLAELNRIQQSFSYEKEKHRMIVATVEDKFVGFVDVDKRQPTRLTTYSYNPRPYLSDLCVHPDYRRKGIARLLVEAAEEFCREEELYIRVEANNLAAVQLYRSMGYEEVDNPDCEDGSVVILHRSII